MENKFNIIIENSTATWVMTPIQGELGGTYNGVFKFRCYLTPLQILSASKEHRELLGQYGGLATPIEENLSFALTQLKQRVLQSPPFWTSTLQESNMPGN